MALTERPTGVSQTTFGSNRDQGLVAINTKLGTASGLVLVDSAGVEYVLWVDTTGDLKIGTRADLVTPDSAGTVIGGQS